MINYSAPSVDGTYNVTINVTNDDVGASPLQEEINISMMVTALTVNIVSPSNSSVLTGVESGDSVNITANATYGSINISNGSSWAVSIGGSVCINASYGYDNASNEWNIYCIAPTLDDGLTYDVTATLIHVSYGNIAGMSSNAITYLDTTKPTFEFVRKDVSLGGNIDVQVNVSDNVGVDSVSGVLFYPNLSSVSLGMNSSGGYYVNNSFALNTAGEYLVNVSANDTTGNSNSSMGWFEVTDNYNWVLNLSDYNKVAVNGTNVSLYRPNTTTLLKNGITSSSGIATLSVNKQIGRASCRERV